MAEGKVIPVTVGRVVYFRSVWTAPSDEPCAAIVTRVFNDRHVNLTVFGRDGTTAAYTSVRFRQPDDAVPQCEFCEWMPYQKGQAQKAEELERQLCEQKKAGEASG